MFTPHLFFLTSNDWNNLNFDPADASSLDTPIRKLRDDNAYISFFPFFVVVLSRPHIPATNAVRLSSDYCSYTFSGRRNVWHQGKSTVNSIAEDYYNSLKNSLITITSNKLK